MSKSQVNLGAAHIACLNEALRQGPLVIELWRSGVFDVLNERYTSSMQNIEKRHLQDAMVALHNYQAEISTGFSAALTSAMASETRRELHGSTDSESGDFDGRTFDDLELMGENEVQDTVDSVRLLQIVAMACEAGLAAFSARLSTAQGFAQVKTDKNPLRPEIFSRALLKAVQELPLDNAVRSLWLTHGSAVMGQQVQALYQALNELLIKRGVAPAAYRVITKQESNIAGSANAPGAGADASDALVGSAFAPLSDHPRELPPIVFPLYEASHTEEPVSETSPVPIVQPDFSDTEAGAMSVFTKLEQQAATPLAQGKSLRAKPLPVVKLRVQPKPEVKDLGQSQAINAVILMIEKIVNDPRLLAPVRQIIASTEPAFLRLAVTEPHFFSDKSHPARNLLETIASRSFAFASEAAPGFAEFLQDLQEAAVLLAQGGAGDVQRFDDVLSGFELRSVGRQQDAYENHRATTHGLLEAEQRNALASKIASEILSRPDFVLRNRTIAGFLTGLWSQVLAKERLAVEADKTGMHKAIFSLALGELLWSIDTKKTMPHPARLAKLIPRILEGLQGGLVSIDSPLADSTAFFDELSAIYDSSLNPVAGPVASNARQALSKTSRKTKPELDALFGLGDSAHRSRTRPAPLRTQRSSTEKDAASRAESHFQTTRSFFDTSPDADPTPALQSRSKGSIHLRLGAWIEFLENDQWLRAQLTWVSLYHTLFLFTSAGGRTHSMTAPLLQYYLLQGLVKVISQNGVLAKAPERVTPNDRPIASADSQASQASQASQDASRF